MKDKISRKSGYTLLFSIIVSSVVLSIAAFILSVSRKQIVLSTVTRDSTLAIYAADSAIQCMVGSYYEGLLATSTKDSDGNVSSVDAQVYCSLGLNLHSSFQQVGQLTDDFNFKTDNGFNNYSLTDPLRFAFSNDTCAIGYVYDGYDKTTLKHKTIIEVRGYNTSFSKPCDNGENAVFNPRAVERAIRLVYTD